MRLNFRMRFTLAGCWFLAFFIFSITHASDKSNTFILETPAVKRVIKVENGKLQTETIINKITGKSYPVQSEEFTLHFFVGGWANASFDSNPKTLTGKDFVFQRVEKFARADTGGYQFTLKHEATGLTVLVRYFAISGQPELRKQIFLSSSNTYKQLLDYIEVENMTILGADVTHQGFGQPVYAANFYLGLEYPAGYNEVQNGVIHLKHYAGQPLTSRVYKSHPAVIGAAGAGKVSRTFLAYIERIKAQPTRPFLLYNSWYDIRTLTDTNLIETIEGFKKYMLEPYDLKLDAFVLDDGWDKYESSWEISPEQFPNGFSNVQKKLQEIDSYLGLWASPWGGYGERRQIRVEWARQNGYEVSGDMLCLAGKKYGEHFRETLSRYQQDYDIRFFKLDGLLTRCNELDHGHLPGLYAQEAEIAQFVMVLKTLRKNNPRVFIDITVGTWLSPWWLMYADIVWMTGADYAYTEDLPTFSARDKAITYRDKVLHDNFLVSQYQFPYSGLMTHGIIKGRLNLLGGENEPLRKFTDNAVIYFSRGVMMWELYITPSILSKAEWDNLAGTIKWAYQNIETLKNTQFILGDPSKGEIYGYLHRGAEQTIITLRNPFLYPQEVRIPASSFVPEKASSNNPLLVQIQYPYRSETIINSSTGDTLRFTLQGNEVLSLKAVPLKENQSPIPVDVPYEIKSIAPKEVEIAFHPQRDFSQVGIYLPRNAKLDLTPSWKLLSRNNNFYQLQWTGNEPSRPKISDTYFGMSGGTFQLTSRVTIPVTSKANQVLLLIESQEKLDTLFTSAEIDGKVTPPSIVKDANDRWWWVTLPLNPGIHQIKLQVQRKDGINFRATFHSILESTVRYNQAPTLKVKLKRKLPSTSAQLPRFGNEIRFTVPLVNKFTIGE